MIKTMTTRFEMRLSGRVLRELTFIVNYHKAGGMIGCKADVVRDLVTREYTRLKGARKCR